MRACPSAAPASAPTRVRRSPCPACLPRCRRDSRIMCAASRRQSLLNSVATAHPSRSPLPLLLLFPETCSHERLARVRSRDVLAGTASRANLASTRPSYIRQRSGNSTMSQQGSFEFQRALSSSVCAFTGVQGDAPVDRLAFQPCLRFCSTNMFETMVVMEHRERGGTSERQRAGEGGREKALLGR